MKGFIRLALCVLTAVLAPTWAFAQASIAGTVKDTSGAVLPGVTVEAASPVLIEKVRTSVTDGNGRYQIIDLRPGAYTVTFTLAGFNTFKRDGVTLAGTGTSTVDADLRVGALEETVTVTGEAPVVNVTSTTTQRVLSLDTANAIPTARNIDQLANLVPGVTISGATGSRNVGNILGANSGDGVTFHGTQSADSRITVNGISVMTLQAGGGLGRAKPEMGSAQEVTFDQSSVSAEMPTGGMRMNIIPRDGGNTLKGTAFMTFANNALTASNYTDRVKTLGLAAPQTLKLNWEVNPGLGGPFKKDKVWFWLSARKTIVQNYAPIFENRNAYDITKWTYEADEAKQGVNKGRYHTMNLRTTVQATPRNKFAFTYKYEGYCSCPEGVSATVSPEAADDGRNPRLRQEHVEWTSPVTSKLLFEAVGMHLFERWGSMHLQPRGSLDDPRLLAIQDQMISVVEQSTGMTYRNRFGNNNTLVPNYTYRVAMAYVTGSHSAKFGFGDTFGFLNPRAYTSSILPVQYRLNGGVPNLITLQNTPRTTKSDEKHDIGIFAQDRWTLGRATINGAVRYDHIITEAPEQVLGPTPLQPNRAPITFAKTPMLNWQDVTYRSGVAFDLFGNGRTALKASFNKYLRGQTLNGLGAAANPSNAMVNQVTRSWNDRGGLGINGDFIPQCDLVAPAANGECGPLSNPNFGVAVPLETFDPELMNGMGSRLANYEFSAGVQHEVVRRVSVDFGFFRRIWADFATTDDLSVSASDFDTFTITAPSNPGLPGGGAYAVTGLLNLKPEAFGRVGRNYNTLAANYGKQQEHWTGVDIGVNVRGNSGLTVMGGLSTGKFMSDNCEIVDKIPELLLGTANAAINVFPITSTGVWTPKQFCHQESPFLTQVKLQSIYTVPKIDVQLSAVYQNIPGPAIQANFVVTNAIAQSALGRTLAGSAPNLTANVLAPGSLYGERLNQLDLSFGRIVKLGTTRTNIRLDVYNFTNADTVVGVNANYGSFRRPTDILPARFAKISATVDF
ncbi:MAG: carboxypeptidase regulatory-like domain-containing protein [Vicinamibacterales bacterium]